VGKNSKGNLKYGYVDKTGNEVIAAQFEGGERFSEGLAAVNIGQKFGFIDTTGKIVINPQFDYSVNEWNIFSEGLACVRVADKYGYIDKAGKFVINPQFDGCSPFNEGLAKVDIGKIGLDQKSGYIDKNGKYVWNPSN
jgi:hypothetical protein